MTPADNDRWPDDMIRLLSERPAPPEPTATEAAAYVGMKLAEWASYFILAICLIGFGVATGWLR